MASPKIPARDVAPPDEDPRWLEYEPPADQFDDGYDGPPPEYTPSDDEHGSAPGRSRSEPSTRPTAGAEVVTTLRQVIAAQHGRTLAEALDMLDQIQASTRVMEELNDDQRATYAGVIDCLGGELANTASGSADLTFLPTLRLYDEYVRTEMAAIVATLGDPATEHPSNIWFALRETVQRRHARRRAASYVEAIDGKVPVESAMASYKAVVEEPPTTKRAITKARAVRTARQMLAETKAAAAGRPKIRFSSGFRTLDVAFTNKGEPMGFITPGEQSLVAGPTGTGKSSLSYAVIPGLAQDLIHWGLVDAKLVFFHTEEESSDKAYACGLAEGQRNHHLADNIIVDACGTSRTRLAETLYDLVIEAKRRRDATGRPIEQFLPHIVVLDYLQSITEQGENEVVATATTSEFLLRGVQAWNHEEMSKFSGVDFRTYAGMAWPEGMEHHRVAVLAFAQLVKQDDKSLFYKPGKRDCQLSDFTLEDDSATPAWADPTGAGWGWQVHEGDMRLLKQNAIRGSGVILQNATTIVLLHRSKPYNNPASKVPDAEGRRHLEDTRARLILDKTRTGSQLKFVPMSFDLQPNGFRAQYYDVFAEEAIVQGRITERSLHSSWTRPGDPILPVRPNGRPLAGFRY